MSDESAASSQEFSLPTVGGGLHDIGEKLPRDLQTGDGNFTVSVALPDGLSGFQPQLNLVYSSGTFGAGWNLNIPGVNRQTSKDIQHYGDANATFILLGRKAASRSNNCLRSPPTAPALKSGRSHSPPSQFQSGFLGS